MRVDDLIANGNDMGETVGEFYGTPVREMYTLAQEFREIDDTQQRVRASLGVACAPIELLPGEVITDGIIRRSTAAEVVGEKFYNKEIPEGRQIPLHEGLVQNQNKGTLITWRPGNQNIAVLHEEVSSELSA